MLTAISSRGCDPDEMIDRRSIRLHGDLMVTFQLGHPQRIEVVR
jgi:hypothetical protein